MRRLISALIALIILADAAPTVSAEPIGPAPGVTYCHVADRQHPTVGQLTAALVTLKELGLLGAGYTVESTGPLQGERLALEPRSSARPKEAERTACCPWGSSTEPTSPLTR